MEKTIITMTAVIILGLILATAIIISASINKPVCSKPYILVGRDCCLDEDGDSICDRDRAEASTTTAATCTTTTETPTTVTTVRTVDVRITSTTATTSTIQSAATHTTVEQTTTLLYNYDFSEILRRVAESSTTTTTSTTMPPCVDSDGGLRFEIASLNVSGNYVLNETEVEGIKEFCMDDKNLMEYYCESGSLRSRVYMCQEVCIEGRCCRGESSVCSGDKDCCSGFCRAVGMRRHCVTTEAGV